MASVSLISLGNSSSVPSQAEIRLRRPTIGLRRLEFALRGKNSRCAGKVLVSRGQNPVCADVFHSARRISGLRKSTSALRGRVSGLRGRNPLCALKNRFARPFFTLHGQNLLVLGFLAAGCAQK